jgi:hypothetical protein
VAGKARGDAPTAREGPSIVHPGAEEVTRTRRRCGVVRKGDLRLGPRHRRAITGRPIARRAEIPTRASTGGGSAGARTLLLVLVWSGHDFAVAA